MYDSYHNFNKYVVSNFYETPSTDSKFDKINNFYKDLLKPDNVESKTADKPDEVDKIDKVDKADKVD